jgi:hypothetical protein
MKSISIAGLVICTSLFSATGVASERGEPNSITDTSVHTRPTDLSLLLWLPYYYGYGVGAQVRFEFPVLPDGFIKSINDEFSLEPSFGIASTRYGFEGSNVAVLNFAPALYGLWSFYFSEPFRAYGGLGLGFNFATYTGTYPGGFAPAYVYWDLVAGISYKFSLDVGFRAEIGLQGFKAGVSFYF